MQDTARQLAGPCDPQQSFVLERMCLPPSAFRQELAMQVCILITDFWGRCKWYLRPGRPGGDELSCGVGGAWSCSSIGYGTGRIRSASHINSAGHFQRVLRKCLQLSGRQWNASRIKGWVILAEQLGFHGQAGEHELRSPGDRHGGLAGTAAPVCAR
jgi:hypothetical protein